MLANYNAIKEVDPLSACRSEELSAALQLYQQAAAVKLDNTQQAAAAKLGGSQQQAEAEGGQSAQAAAEASLKLALLCNDLLQVWSLRQSCCRHCIAYDAGNCLLLSCSDFRLPMTGLVNCSTVS